MNLEGTFRFDAGMNDVWIALNDSDVLSRATPGCKEFTPAGTDRYSAMLEMGVAGIKGKYKGHVSIADRQAPTHYRLLIEGQGAPGFVKANMNFDLSPVGEATTELVYRGDAQVGGLVAGVGQRILAGVAKMIMDQFFKTVNESAKEGKTL